MKMQQCSENKNVYMDLVMWLDFLGGQLSIGQNELHLWRAFFSPNFPFHADITCFCSEEERFRGFRFIRAEDQQKFFFSRYVLRTVLSYYFNISPKKIVFSFGQNGKPFILNSDIKFNLSHSGNCILLGVMMNTEIGVDVEIMGKKHDFLALAKRFFTASEFNAIRQSCSENERMAAFYRCWTRKEAFVKATGSGLSFGLSDFEVDVAEVLSKPSVLLHIRNDVVEARKWWLQSISMSDLVESYFAAFAVPQELSSIVLRNFS